MTGVNHWILCSALFLLEAEEANSSSSWEGEGSTLLLTTVNEVRINEWISEYFFSCAKGCIPKGPNGNLADSSPCVTQSDFSAEPPE